MVDIKIDISNDKELKARLENEMVCIIRDFMNNVKDPVKIETILAKSLERYFSWKNTSIENFVKTTIIDFMASISGDKSNIDNVSKSESYMHGMIRDAVKKIVSEKLANIKITGFDS